MGYLANFMVYTLAMVGIIAVALLIFKHSGSFSCGTKSKHMKVLDSLSLAPRKTLYIVSVGSEKFLLAGDADKTSLISKLNCSPQKEELSIFDEKPMYTSFKETMENLPKQSFMDTSNIGIKSSLLNKNATESHSVIRSLAERIR